MSNNFTVNTYSPKDVLLVIGGYQLTGWQSIAISRSAKSFTVIRGIRGKNTRVSNRDYSATVVISLLQTSQANDVLSTILTADEENGTARIALTLKDKSGNSVFSTSEAFITGFPVSSYSGQFEYRNWEIFAQTTNTYVLGGNGEPSNGLVNDAIKGIGNLIDNIF